MCHKVRCLGINLPYTPVLRKILSFYAFPHLFKQVFENKKKEVPFLKNVKPKTLRSKC